MARRILWASLALAPATILVDRLAHPGKTALFVLAAAALIPLAWLIGESTEHAAEHTGPGIGGYLNASFGNAPELIIALVAVSDGLYQVVLGSLAGSVISNLLLVFGISQIVAENGCALDRRSLFTQIGLCAAAIGIAAPAIVLGWTGHSHHTGVVASIPVSIALLAVYLVVAGRNLKRHSQAERREPRESAWSLPLALGALGVATAFTAVISELLVHSLQAFAHAIGATDFFIAAIVVAGRNLKRHSQAERREPRESAWSLPLALATLGIATAFTAVISEILVHSLQAFAHAIGATDFFIAAIVVAVVGNAAEHGGAVVIARSGNMKLASEIAISSSAQVALLVTPAVMLLSLAFSHHLALSFRWEETAAMAGAVGLTALFVGDARSLRWEGGVLVASFLAVAVWFWLA